MTAAEEAHIALIRSMRCVVCVRFGPPPGEDVTKLHTEAHHLGTGSSQRNHFLLAPLCGHKFNGGHHRGPVGFHGLGNRAFVRFYKVPHDSEYGLLAWVNEDLAAMRGRTDASIF